MDGIAAFIQNLLLVRDTCDRYVKLDQHGMTLVEQRGVDAPNWTKRDRRRLAFVRGKTDGFAPPSRMTKYRDILFPRYGESKIDEWYIAALATAVASEQTTLLKPVLDRAKQCAARFIDEATNASDFDRDWSAWGSPTAQELNSAVMDLEQSQRAVAVANHSPAPSAPPPALGEATSPAAIVRDAATEARDKWLYDQCVRLVAYSAIIAKLANKPGTWPRLESTNGIKNAASAYALRHGLPAIPPRARGRRAAR